MRPRIVTVNGIKRVISGTGTLWQTSFVPVRSDCDICEFPTHFARPATRRRSSSKKFTMSVTWL